MATHPSAPTASPPSNGGGSRLNIRSIKEMPAQRDEELAVIFAEMRRAAGVTREQIAGRLATSVATVEALENGALSDLPDWPEVKRIVTAYAAQLGLDSRPILRRMESQIGVEETAAPAPQPSAPPQRPAPKPAASAPAAPSGPPMPPAAGAPPKPGPSAAQGSPPQPPGASPQPQPAPAEAEAKPSPQPEPAAKPQPAARSEPAEEPAPKQEKRTTGRVSRILKGLLNWLLLIGFVGALGAGVWYAARNPRAVWTTLDGLPEPIPRLMRSAWELVRPLDNGKSGTSVSDPEKRKSDKLP